MAHKLGVDIRAIRLLLETGVLASYEGFHAEGESLVRRVASFRDDVPQPAVCLISAFYFQGRYEEAITDAKALLKKFPNCQMAKALMGTCMFSAGYRDWEVPLKEVMEDGRDEWAIDMARSVLGYDHKSSAVSRPPVSVGRHVGAMVFG
jgi:hypothetical protein